MATLGRTIGKKAAKATVKHAEHGVVSKAKRQPLRSVTLLSIGGFVGGLTGWAAGRITATHGGDARPIDAPSG
jgi:hypothetical protein